MTGIWKLPTTGHAGTPSTHLDNAGVDDTVLSDPNGPPINLAYLVVAGEVVQGVLVVPRRQQHLPM